MFVSSLVQTVRRNVSRALTSSVTAADDFKDIYITTVHTHEFAGYWQEQITKATTRASLHDVTTRILNCLNASICFNTPSTATAPPYSPRSSFKHGDISTTTALAASATSSSSSSSSSSSLYEEKIFVIKDLGLRQLLEAIYQDINIGDTLPPIDTIVTLPFSNESSNIKHNPVLLKFEHLFVLSGMSALMVTHIYSHRELLKNDSQLLESVTNLLSELSLYPKTAAAIANSLILNTAAMNVPKRADNVPNLDSVEILHSISKGWKLETLMTTIQGLWSRYRHRMSDIVTRSPRGRQTPLSSRADSSGKMMISTPQSSSITTEAPLNVPPPSSSPIIKREPSSSAESLGELKILDPYVKLQDMAADQVKELEAREFLINLGTLTLRLQKVHDIASKFYEQKRLNDLQELRRKISSGCESFEKHLTEIQQSQKEQESRFELTKSAVSIKLNKELEDLQSIKENTAKERSVLEREIEELRALITQKENALEALKQKEQHISELFCQISQEIDSLDLSYNMLSTDSLTAIKEGKKILEQLGKIRASLMDDTQVAQAQGSTIEDFNEDQKFTSEDVSRIIEDYTTRALPKFYQTEHDLIKLGCDRLKSQSPTARGISPYRPTLAQMSILLDRQAKYVENAMRDLTLEDLGLADITSYDRTYEKAYMDCRSLIKSNHQLIFA